MPLDARVELSASCDKCDAVLDEGDEVFCVFCAGQGLAPKVTRIVDKVRWIGDELRDSNVDWRIVERVRELEADLLA